MQACDYQQICVYMCVSVCCVCDENLYLQVDIHSSISVFMHQLQLISNYSSIFIWFCLIWSSSFNGISNSVGYLRSKSYFRNTVVILFNPKLKRQNDHIAVQHVSHDATSPTLSSFKIYLHFIYLCIYEVT